jgi:hypothetical protein
MQPLVDGLGEPGIGLKNTLTISLIVPGAAVAGLYWGLIGLCVASVAGVVVAVTINLRRNLVLLDAGYGQLLSAFFPSMLAAGIMYAAVLGANAMLAHAIPVLWRPPRSSSSALLFTTRRPSPSTDSRQPAACS